MSDIVDAIKTRLVEVMVNKFHLPVVTQIKLLAEVDMVADRFEDTCVCPCKRWRKKT